MSLAKRWQYYRRIVPAYRGAGRSELTFWHETPEVNPKAFDELEDEGAGAQLRSGRLGPYYMLFREKANYAEITTTTAFQCSIIAAQSDGSITRLRLHNGGSGISIFIATRAMRRGGKKR